VAFAVLVAVIALLAPPAAARSGTPGWWRPAVDDHWQIQLSGRPDLGVPADVYELDLDAAPAAMVARLHAAGRRAICYVDAGTWEAWRRDADAYPAEVIGRPLPEWPGERWLDIRRLDVLGPIIEARVARCARAGFDGVDFDNVDGFENRTGFPLTSADQLRFNRWLARAAHAAGLAVVLKNDLAQARALEPAFDAAVLEQCVAYAECRLARPFVDAGKHVVDIEYGGSLARSCAVTRRLGIELLRKRLALGAWVARCRGG
jgi:hypothetical protein